MHAITIINGLRQEGKTTELIERYKSLQEELANPEIKTRYKAYLIVCCPDAGCADELSRVIRERDGVISEIATTESELKDKIITFVTASDCAIFIDDPDTIVSNVSQWLTDLSDTFPNKEIGNACDIVFTRLRVI